MSNQTLTTEDAMYHRGKAPNATRALTLEGALSCLDVAKARLRSGLTTQGAETQARQCTRYEDWLEVSHPRSPLRQRLKTVRRRLEGVGSRGR